MIDSICPKCKSRLRINQGGYIKCDDSGYADSIPAHITCIMCGYYKDLPKIEKPKPTTQNSTQKQKSYNTSDVPLGWITEKVSKNYKKITKQRKDRKSWDEITEMLKQQYEVTSYISACSIRTRYHREALRRGDK